MDGRWVLDLADGSATPSSCSAEEVEQARRVLGAGPVAWAALVAREAESVVVDRMPELAELPSAAAVRRPSEACILVVLRAILDDSEAAAADVPRAALESNRDGVHRNVPLDHILHAMWIAHAHLLQRLLAVVQDELPAERVPGVMRRTTELAFACVEAFTAHFSREYSREQSAWLGSLAASRRELVEDLLASRVPAPGRPERVLGLDLAHRHVGVVIRASPAADGPESLLDRVARGVVAAAAPPASVTVLPGAGTLWLWMTWPGAGPDGLVSLLRRTVPVPAGVRVGVGPALPGPEGFRTTHLAAAAADRVAAAGPDGAPPIADHAELDVIALLTADPDQAAAFVRQHLGPHLLAADERTADLRTTLRHYLAQGRSRVAAARILHIAPGTVGYRVRQVEQLRGAPLPTDALRLRLALEVVDHLDHVDPAPRT